MSDLNQAALNYAAALKAQRKGTDLPEFERMVVAWKKQPQFRWAGVNLEMTEDVVRAFRRQLTEKQSLLNIKLEEAEQTLHAYAKRLSESD